MKLYDVDGYDYPLRLSDEHAELIGATEHVVETQQPKRSANRQAWVDYALSQGGDPIVVSESTRSALIEQYGS